jgi:hypothetical protein
LRYINAGTEFAGDNIREGDSKIGDVRMPIHLPPKARAKALPVRKQAAIDSIDWLGLWALSLGFCAIVLAAIAYFMNGDATGAGGILAGAAAIIAVVVHLGAEREKTGGEN